MFTRSAGVWSEQAKLIAGGFEGAGVALDGDTAVIGSPTYGCCFQGAAFVFRRNANVWGFAAELNASDRRGGDGLGPALQFPVIRCSPAHMALTFRFKIKGLSMSSRSRPRRKGRVHRRSLDR